MPGTIEKDSLIQFGGRQVMFSLSVAWDSQRCWGFYQVNKAGGLVYRVKSGARAFWWWDHPDGNLGTYSLSTGGELPRQWRQCLRQQGGPAGERWLWEQGTQSSLLLSRKQCVWGSTLNRLWKGCVLDLPFSVIPVVWFNSGHGTLGLPRWLSW